MAIKQVQKKPVGKEDVKAPASSKEEQIGFHKGALSTLAKEREEMLKILSIVEQLMQMHVSALKQLGVDLEKMAAAAQKSKPLESQLR